MILNEYREIGKIDAGNYGIVYKLKKDSNTYAGKFVDNNSIELKELVILSQMKHPNIIRLDDFMFIETGIYLIFPYQKQTLDDVNIKKMDKSDKDNIIKELISAVMYLHSYKIFHGDIKPENILYNDKKILLIDFGLSGHVDSQNLSMQTSWFRSPEMMWACLKTGILNVSIKHINIFMQVVNNLSSDLWALGCVIFYIISSYHPFKENSDTKVVERIIKYLDDPNSKLTRYLGKTSEMIADLLHPNPEKRNLSKLIKHYNILTDFQEYQIYIDRDMILSDTYDDYLVKMDKWCNDFNLSKSVYVVSVDIFLRLTKSYNEDIDYISIMCVYLSMRLFYSNCKYMTIGDVMGVSYLNIDEKTLIDELDGKLFPYDIYDKLVSLERPITITEYKKMIKK